jgi:uncharacterized zinc-type alcohol dehydrogenase-like protein
MYQFPMFPGHEGIGRVLWVGSLVQHLKEGDIVGLGIYRSACGACEDCSTGHDNYCAKKKLMFAGGCGGTLSEYVRVKGKFALPLPEGLDPKVSGPLLCAGMTIFSPFANENIRPGDRVGVLGIGGLGHLALLFGKALGCRMSAISRGTEKKADAERFGAVDYIDVNDEGSMKAHAGSLDYLLGTSAGKDTKYDALLGLLAPGGKFVLMGNPGMAQIPVSLWMLVTGNKTISGSGGCSSGHALRMLRVAGQNKIVPTTEVVPAAELKKVWDKVLDGSIRYRGVISFE